MTCSATSRSSDQLMAEVSKLPDSACLPSEETATARTGPPWPRNCACAAPNMSGNSNKAAQKGLVIRRLHAERGDPFAGRIVAQGFEKGLHGRPFATALDYKKIVMF